MSYPILLYQPPVQMCCMPVCVRTTMCMARRFVA